jgi:hypothetical protein
MSTERITITFNEDQTFRGASSQDFNGSPVPLDEAGLAELIPTINEAALVRAEAADPEKDGKIAALEDFQNRVMQLIGGIKQAIESGAPAEEVVTLVAGSIQTGLAPEKIREATELERQIAELTAKAEALRASTAP